MTRGTKQAILGWLCVGYVVVVVTGAIALWATAPTVQAQQRPYEAYPVRGGCLYITAQGYAVYAGGSCQ